MLLTRITRLAMLGVAATVGLALIACGGNPLDAGSAPPDDVETVVIGSQAYYSNEVIAEIYAQALEADGMTVERRFNIGGSSQSRV